MNPNDKIILAGGSGFLGRALASALTARGCSVVILTRTLRPRADGAITELQWDGKSPGPWAAALDGAAAVVNLTGRSVNCRYTPANRREIVESRVDSIRALAAAIAQCKTRPKVWVQASSLAIYGNAGDRWCDETAPPGDDFPSETCRLWEQAFDSITLPATRKVVIRISFALGPDGGALRTLATITRLFLGGAVGSGRQYISWIHNTDLVRMFEWAIERDDIAGPFNATGPNPVTNTQFMRELRRALGRPWSPPVPAWLARIGAWAMGTEASLALTGRRGVPRRFTELGFQFQFPGLRPAIESLFRT
ncbi:MAG: TIGR01777 family oxidoreductase [Chthoniobacteraceae bacterium]|jgi:uncharacterized protein (TIGR01777 family)